MDSLKKLFENRQYELIVKLTENSEDSESLIIRLQALYCLGDDKKALDLIKNHLDDLLDYRLSLMEIHFNILFAHKLFKNIDTMIDYYDSLPYVSMECEEFIKEQKNRLDNVLFAQPQAERKLDVDEIKSLILNPGNEEEMAYTFDMIRTMNVHLFLKEIKQFLVSNYDDLIKTFALLLLVDQQVREEVEILKKGINYKLIPYELTPPFTDEVFDELTKMLLGRIKDPSIANVAIQLLNSYILFTYPNEIQEDELDLLSTCFTIIAHDYLSSEVSVLELANQYGIDDELLEAKIDEISEILANK